jgi:hypothetical protein
MQYTLKYLRSISNTTWLYPKNDLTTALKNTTIPHTYDGSHIVCATLSDLIALYDFVFNQTAISQPIGNVGFSLGVGTHLEDMGDELEWQLPGGRAVLKWRLLKQLTPQTVSYIPVPGNSPADTVGYGTVWASYNITPPSEVLDIPLFVRF